MIIQENISLSNFTTFRTGGAARYFVKVKSVEDLKKAVCFAKEKKQPFFVLGKGANMLVSDDNYHGVVIKMEIGGIECEKRKNGVVRVTAGAGIDWDSFVRITVKNGYQGLENLSYIPGTVGASAVGNIGAYGVEAKDFISSVHAFNTDSMKIEKFSKKKCEFKYRESFFKTKKGKKYIVIKVFFDLHLKNKFKIDYNDVKDYFLRKKIVNPNQKKRDHTISRDQSYF